MRLALVAQWLRVAAHDTQRRSTALSYATTLLIAQAVWAILTLFEFERARLLCRSPDRLCRRTSGTLSGRRKGGTPGIHIILLNAMGFWPSLRWVKAMLAQSPCICRHRGLRRSARRRAAGSGRHRPDFQHVVDLSCTAHRRFAASRPGPFDSSGVMATWYCLRPLLPPGPVWHVAGYYIEHNKPHQQRRHSDVSRNSSHAIASPVCLSSTAG